MSPATTWINLRKLPCAKKSDSKGRVLCGSICVTFPEEADLQSESRPVAALGWRARQRSQGDTNELFLGRGGVVGVEMSKISLW